MSRSHLLQIESIGNCIAGYYLSSQEFSDELSRENEMELFLMISTGNKTEWSSIRSVIIRVLIPINHKNYTIVEKRRIAKL